MRCAIVYNETIAKQTTTKQEVKAMAKMTIAQQRERAVYQLAQRKNPTPTEQDLQDARKTMNSFYRLFYLFF